METPLVLHLIQLRIGYIHNTFLIKGIIGGWETTLKFLRIMKSVIEK
jgi:hypothetical protein